MKKSCSVMSVVVWSLVLVAACYAQCPDTHQDWEDAKPNKLYLYFPTSDDSSYPEFGFSGLNTSPAHKFDAAELTNYTGTTADLRDKVYQVVRDDYCEFNVNVIPTTSAPVTTEPRRNTVAAGTDTDPSGSGTFGLAQAVDVGDATAVDYARVWAGTYQTEYGGSGGALNGANSTLDRWARSIGGTMAHEGGHNYGMSHSDGLVLHAGEDPLVHHIMAAGSNFSGEDRAGYRRHFSDKEYSILASNVGLSVATMWNFDMVNPNAETAVRLRMTFLNTKPSLAIGWWWGGSSSPWVNPTLTGSLGTTTFKGTTYNRYQIEWSTGQAWSPPGGGPAQPSGQVPGGVRFHIGATFTGVSESGPDAIIIIDTTLFDSGGNALALHPRMPGFDSGTLDSKTGNLNLRLFNFGTRPLRINNVVIRDMPRAVSLNAMVAQSQMFDVVRTPVAPWEGSVRQIPALKTLAARPKQLMLAKLDNAKLSAPEVILPIGKLSQKRHVVQTVTRSMCDTIDRLRGGDVKSCHEGTNVDLFPATSVYITANVVEPAAKHWDPEQKKYVIGAVSTTVYYQIAGRHPDVNKNGVDDFLDIKSGRFRDNGKGIPILKRP